MDEFEKSKMAKARPLVKNEMYKWFDCLIIHIREFMKKSASNAQENMKLFQTNVHQNILKAHKPKKVF